MSSQLEKQRAEAAVVGAKTARACDNCLRRRARWYCAADDAFLCQSCDASVHSANSLARRHHRVRLKTASSIRAATASSSSSQVAQPNPTLASDGTASPAWLHGFKRKTRTPRGKPGARAAKADTLVPDLEAIAAEESKDSDEEHLLYSVPIFNPDLADLCCPPSMNDANISFEESKPPASLLEHSETAPDGASDAATDGLAGFHPSEVDLAKFAEDIDTLLGRELEDNDSSYISDLGLMVKPGIAEACWLDMEINPATEMFDLDFRCGSPTMILSGEAEEARATPDEAAVVSDGFEEKPMILKLDYEAAIAAWSSKGVSPWIEGLRQQLDPRDFLKLLGETGDGEGELLGGSSAQIAGIGDGGREAKVTRYREKKRTRLFSKKIRYEVRKLNAEKRPRMKGRFVKRAAAASLPATAAAARGGLAPLSFRTSSHA